MKVAAAIAAVTAIAVFAYHLGTNHAAAKAGRRETDARADAAAALARTTDEYRRAERALQGRIDHLTRTHLQEISRLERSSLDVAARLRSRAVRVSVPIAACRTAEPDRVANVATAAPRAELAPETAIALDRIAADGDAAILDLNACLATYASAQAAVAAH